MAPMTVAVRPRVAPPVGAVAALAAVAGVGPLAIRELIDRVVNPIEALSVAPEAEELSVKSRAAVREALAGRTAGEVARVTASEAAQRLGPDDRLLAYGTAGYPERLSRLYFPPPLLWARGPLPADAPRAVAIVGTRRASRNARDLAHDLAVGLAAQGVRVISGLAAGIDAAGHRGALAAGGETLAVLGSGLRYRYPQSNHDLYARLQAEGLLLTEFAPDIRPEAHNFPRRNRIVAALCDGVLVVQAGRRSGALLTAGEAKEIGVEVLACPGDPRLAASTGSHDLIRDGAALVTSPEDVFEALGWEEDDASSSAAGVGLPLRIPARGGGLSAVGADRLAVATSILARLEEAPAPLDELATLAGGVRRAAALLARLELAGEVVGRPGGRYERARRSE
jgi:DNA processing protein